MLLLRCRPFLGRGISRDESEGGGRERDIRETGAGSSLQKYAERDHVVMKPLWEAHTVKS